MIRVTAMYPNTPGAKFDHGYYLNTHMPLVASKMGSHLKSYSVDKGLAGGAPDTPATYVCVGHMICESVDAFQAGFGPHADVILGDIANFTDIAPVLQISEMTKT